MNYAQRITDCDGCSPSGYSEACALMDRIVTGSVDAETVLCEDHIREMEESAERHINRGP